MTVQRWPLNTGLTVFIYIMIGEIDSNDYEENIEEESSSDENCLEDYDTSDTDDDEEFSDFKDKFKGNTVEPR